MKALTISQPYASMIADGWKWVENRRWPTGYRGPLAIHAGKGTQYLDRDELAQWPTGSVLAVGNLVACVHRHAIVLRDPLACDQLLEAGVSPESFLHHKHTEGPWCWVLMEVHKLAEPYPCRGQQGLWDVELPKERRKEETTP